MPVSARHVKKRQIISLFVEFPPRSFMWGHNGRAKKVVAIAEAVVIIQEKDQQHNPIHTTIGFAIEEIEEHGGSDVVTSVVLFFL
jgi:hypothetical protein